MFHCSTLHSYLIQGKVDYYVDWYLMNYKKSSLFDKKLYDLINLLPTVNKEDGIELCRKFMYDEKRICKKCQLFTKWLGLLYHVSSMFACIQHIEKNKLFITYCIALIGMCISACNLTRYECAFHACYGRVFRSFEAFRFWKLQQLPCLNYVLGTLEALFQIYFFIEAWPFKLYIYNDKNVAAYALAVLLLQIHALSIIIVCIFLILSSCIVMICSDTSIHPRLYSYALRPSPASAPAPVQLEIFVDKQQECCICLDKNAEHWLTTQCNHSFHQECLSNWTRTNNATCPICRTNLF